MIDLVQAERFIEILTGSSSTPMVWQVFDDNKPRSDRRLARVLVGTIKQHIAQLSRANDNNCGVFCQANEGLHRGVKGIVAPRALFADDDGESLLPPLVTLPPTMVVQSSAAERNKHYYWRLAPGEPLTIWSEAQARIARSLNTDPSMANVDRVMRLPGSMNRKVDPGKGRNGPPFPVRILEAAPSRIYTIGDAITAFPDPAKPSPDVTIDLDKGTIFDATGIPIGAPGEGPPLPGDENDPSPAATRARDRIRAWLHRQHVAYDKKRNRKRPLHFLLRRCVFNPDHVDVMAIRVVPTTGAIWAGCWHNSCHSNQQRWIEVAEKIGGWGIVDTTGFRIGSQTEIASRALRDAAAGSPEEIIFAAGAFHRYSPLSGVWHTVDEATLSKVIQGYDGRSVGDGGRRLVVGRKDVAGAVDLAADRAARPDFFADCAAGIAFANGFVRADGEGINVEPFSPIHRAQAALAFAYDPEAECPRFAQYLEEVFAPDEDAPLKKRLLQEHMGVALLGLATRYETALFLPGRGSNGKSSLSKIIRALFPEGTITTVPPQKFGNDRFRARLAPPVRLNIVAETPEGEVMESEAFKASVSGDPTAGQKLYVDLFDFTPIAAHWFIAQELPAVRDTSHGFWRKVTVIAFNRVFAVAEQDRYVADYIIENELAGVAAWAVAGAKRAVAQGGFSVVASSEAAKKAWQGEADVVRLFLDECCKPPEGDLPPLEAEETSIDDLYEHYRAWARATGHSYVLTRHSLGKRLARLQISSRRAHGQYVYAAHVYNPPPTSEYR